MTFTGLIFRNLRRQRTRSLLTLLGISLGIATIVVLYTFSYALKVSFSEALQGGGADVVAAQRNVADVALSSVDEAAVATVAAIPGVREATGVLLGFPRLRQTPFFVLYGYPLGQVPESLVLVEGRWMERPGEIALGRVAAANLGFRLGNTVEFDGRKPLRVVGIYESGNAFNDGAGVTSLADAQEIMGQKGKISLISVKLDPRADLAAVMREIEARVPQVLATRSLEFLDTQEDVKLLDAFAFIFSLLAVVIGGIGVMNTVMMSVFERTREIGILRALGWKRRRIMAMVLGESLGLSVVGAGVGSALGVVVVVAITRIPMVRGFVEATFATGPFLLGALVGLLVGALGGLYPAWRASRFSPMEAIRHE